MKAIAPLLALAILAIAPSPALADTVRFRHDHGYSKLYEHAGSVGTTTSNSVPWASIAVALTIVAAAAVLLTTLHLTRRTHRTAP